MPGAATTAIALLAAASAAQGKATLALDGAVARGLRAQGVAVARQAVLPVAGGTFRNGAALRLRGKVTLRARSGGSVRRVTFTGWRAQVRGGTTKLTTVVGKRRQTVLSATVPARKLTIDRATGAVRLQRVPLRLTRAGARVVRARLGLARLRAGHLGTLRITAKLPASKRGGGITGGSGGGSGRGTAPKCQHGFTARPPPEAPPPLTRPAGALDVASATITWRPRPSWIQYLAMGEGVLASDGAIPGPEETVGGNPARLVYSFTFPLKPGSWIHPDSGMAAIYGRGTLRFSFRAHTIDIRVKDPEIEINGASSRAIVTAMGGDCTEFDPVRSIMLDLTPGAPSVAGSTYDFGAIPANITDAGAEVLSGIYEPGLDWGTFEVAVTSE